MKRNVGPFEELARELHKPIRRKFTRRQVHVFEVDEIWGADLIEMQEWSRVNKGYRYMLNVIDVFSKYAWSIPLKDKRGETTAEAFKQIVSSSGRQPKHLWVDQGKEFYNKNLDDWLKKLDINRYSTFGEHKSAVVERFNRSIKEKMWKRFTAENTRNWIDMIDDLIAEYNNTKHSTVKMTPIEASKKENEAFIINSRKYRNLETNRKFEVGDRVRISRIKGVFEKGFLPNWSEAVYKISKVQYTSPITYKLTDSLGEEIEGGFYAEELQKTNQENYRIEKVLQRKKIKGVEHALVKWVGYNKKFNEWIPISNLQNLDS